MANYKQVSYGSKGSDVTELQNLLNQNGYNLEADGVFGAKTQEAVRDYQKKNNLVVDGIAGNQTLGALSKASAAQAPAAPQLPAQSHTYQESDTVTAAKNLLDQQLAEKPGAYQSKWEDQLSETINQILNREDFSYNMNADALYQQYKDQYAQQGKLAMMDTMGQAAAMTGGYGSSYAQGVGQQVYQGYLQQMNDRIPELYRLALSKFQQEGDDLATKYGLLAAQEGQDYDRYQAQLSEYLAERDYLAGRYDSERGYDYSKFTDDRNFAYQQERDQEADRQWQAQFDEAKRQYDQQYALSTASGGSGGGSSEQSETLTFQKAVFRRQDADGNYIFDVGGKEIVCAPGVNPYTGGKNKDVANGAFSNGYQPNNINGQKLTKSGTTDVVNGVTQNVWKTEDGRLWIWDGTQNQYLSYVE